MLKENFVHKMILAVLTGAAVSLPATANAVLQVGSGPITVSLADPIGQTVWDVDGDGNADFHIVNEDSGSVEFLAITSAGLNGRGFAGPATDQAAITRVSFGGQIGRTLATGTWGLWGAGSRIVGNHTAVHSNGHPGLSWLLEAEEQVLVAFRFDSGRGLQYGWAAMFLDLDSSRTSLTIEQWAYETTPDTDVIAGTVNAPSSGVAALTLLGLGAAGLRRWRGASKT